MTSGEKNIYHPTIDQHNGRQQGFFPAQFREVTPCMVHLVFQTFCHKQPLRLRTYRFMLVAYTILRLPDKQDCCLGIYMGQQTSNSANHSLNIHVYTRIQSYTPVFYRFRSICICQFGSATSIARLLAAFPNFHNSHFHPQQPTKDPFSCIARIMLIVSGLPFCNPRATASCWSCFKRLLYPSGAALMEVGSGHAWQVGRFVTLQVLLKNHPLVGSLQV